MFYVVLNYYKNKCGLYNRVFKHMKVLYMLSKVFQIFAIPLFLLLFFINSTIMLITAFSLFICFILAIIYFFNKKAKKIMRLKYDINVEKGIWNNEESLYYLFMYDKEIIKDYIKLNGISIIKLEQLAIEIEDEIPKYKPKFPVIPSLIAALFIALCSNQITWLYENGGIKTIKDSFIIFLLISFIIIILWGVLSLSKMIILTMNEVLNSKDYFILKRFLRIIKDIVIDERELEQSINS